MTLRYEYSLAESYYVLLTFLTIILIPATYYFYVYHSTSTGSPHDSRLGLPAPRKCPCSQCHQHVHSSSVNTINNAISPSTAFGAGDSLLRKLYHQYLVHLSLSSVSLVIGWLSFLYVVIQICISGTVIEVWDPHSVLGIATSASRAEIKKAYHKLSLLMHPDKVAASMRKEAESKFIDISKAYKVLTNAKARQNFEMFGHPDGPQATSFGIALPPWVTNPTFVIIAYLSLLSLLAFAVYRYFTYGQLFGIPSNKTFDNGLMKDPIDKLTSSFRQAKETSSPLNVDQVFTMITGTARAHYPDFALTADQVKLLPKGARDISSNPIMLALQAYLHRVIDSSLPVPILRTLELTNEAILGLVIQRGRMVDVNACINAQRALITAIKPGDSQLLALPHMTMPLVTKLGAHLSPAGLYKQGQEYLDSKLGNLLSQIQRDDIWQVMGDIPYIQIIGCTFGDISGDATPGNEMPVHTDSDIISCTIKLNITTLRDQITSATTTTQSTTLNNVNSNDKKNRSEVPSSVTNALPSMAYVHSPYYPGTPKRSGIWLFVSETTRPKFAQILNATYIALDDPNVMKSYNDVTKELLVRIAIKGFHVNASFSITVSAFTVPHWSIDESRTFKLKLDTWSKKQRAIIGIDDNTFMAKDLPPKYSVVDVPLPPTSTSTSSSVGHDYTIINDNDLD